MTMSVMPISMATRMQRVSFGSAAGELSHVRLGGFVRRDANAVGDTFHFRTRGGEGSPPPQPQPQPQPARDPGNYEPGYPGTHPGPDPIGSG